MKWNFYLPLPGEKVWRLSGGSILLTTRDPIWLYGVTSLCGDPARSHVILLDYDRCLQTVVAEDVKMLQALWRLGDGYIIQSSAGRSGHYHVVFPERHSFQEVVKIAASSAADPLHVESALRTNCDRTWTLRISEKMAVPRPRWVQTVRSMYAGEICSLGHINYLRDVGVPEDDLSVRECDIFAEPVKVRYATRNYHCVDEHWWVRVRRWFRFGRPVI